MPRQVDSALVMLSPGEIATREGVSKQAISKVIKRHLDDGHNLPVERDARGRIAKVSLAHLDHLRGRYSNSAKVSAGRQQSARMPELPFDDGELRDDDSRDEALRQQAWLKLQRDQIEHDEEMGRLVRVDRIEDAVAQAGRSIQAEVSRLQNYADDIALAVSKEGTSGARMKLREIGVEICQRIAKKLAAIAEEAPEEDEPLGDPNEST